MKRIACISLFIIVLTGCKKMLDENAYSAIYTKDFYSTASEAEAALTAVYGNLYVMYSSGSPLFVGEWSADQMFPRNVVGRNTLTVFSYDAAYSVQNSNGRSNESPIEIWKTAYKGIESANWVIEKVPAVNMDTVRRNAIVGEALFLRAFFHWSLAKNFGSIVVKTSPTNSIDAAFTGRQPIDKVYDQITADLVRAERLLPDYTTAMVRGRASKQAAQLLHAKAALYAERWSEAFTSAQTVIDSKKHLLIPSFTDLFTAAKKDAARAEVLFAVELSNITNPIRQSQIHFFCAPIPPSDYSKGGAGGMYCYSAFLKSFATADKRRDLLATTYTQTAGNVVVPQANIDTRLLTKDLVLMGKYKDPNAVGAYGSNNVYLLRLADAYLIAAEAEARANGVTANAYKNINEVRTRAGIANLVSGLSPTAFVDSVLQERSWEFYGEGDRWYDLTRTKKFLTVVPAAVNADYPVRTPLAKHRYFPIPQVEINANPMLTQNDDWR
ncbi:MAG: carbohydrate-binding protein SusD [Sediminibacterium sp.]|nr:carbohydrate-binding protein SusD [Sediminibacterium sp.]